MKNAASAWSRAHSVRSLQGLALTFAAIGTLAGCTGGGGFDLGDSSPVSPPTSSRPGGNIPRGVVAGLAGEPEMRVRILAAQTKLSVAGGVGAVWVAATGDVRPAAKMTAPVHVSLDERQWVLTDAAGLSARFDRALHVELSGEEGTVGQNLGERGEQAGARPNALPASVGLIRPGTPAITDSAMLTVNGRRYPGVIRLGTRSDVSPRAFDVLEYVAMEEYLKGVVAAEMLANWPLAAYQAQAVAARSYAVHERARARASGERFDVEASVRDQAYAGGVYPPLVSRAVESTRGVILTWAAQPLRAYYSSTCGGRPAAARDTWPTGPGFDYNLVGPVQGQPREHACQGATYYKWTVVRNRSELHQRLRAFGRANGSAFKNITGLDSIRSAGVGLSGRPNRFLIMQPGGQTYTITGEELRRAANQDVPGVPKITSATRVHSSDADVQVVGDTVTFTGRGFGHGVGMCQWCAKGFADQGEPWAMIAQRFYPGARLERVY